MPPDRVALITGATGNLGTAVAARLAADGVRLGLVGRDPARLAALTGRLALPPEQWMTARGDLREAADARAVAAAVTTRFGRIDLLLHLVGGWVGGTSVADLAPDELRAMVDQHLWTTFNVVQAVVPGMVAQRWGRIAAVSSPFAGTPGARMSAYGTAKAAEEALLGALAREVAGAGVTVNVVVVRTIDADHVREREPSDRTATWTTPEELAEVLAFLASDAAASLNGARIPLYGRA